MLVEHVDVAGGGDEDIADRGSVSHRHHTEAVHDRFQRLHRVDFGDDHVAAQPIGPPGNAAAAPAVARHDHRLARDQHVGGADHAVDRALAGAVAVVEQVLSHRVVDCDDGEHQLAVVRHRAQPDDAGGGLLGAADDAVQQLAALLVDRAHQVSAVVHRDVRLEVERGLDVLVVGRVVLALDRVDRHLVVRNEGCGHVVLRRQRVGRGQHHVGAAGLQHAHQIGGLRGDMETGRHANALQRLLLREALLDQIQHRHFTRGPLHAVPALLGQTDVFDVVVGAHSIGTPCRLLDW